MYNEVMIKLKRIYEKPTKDDGLRILVDRLWPRGVAKSEARIDIWLKEIAPSDKLRKLFGHKETKWDDFKRRYTNELKDKILLLKPVIKYLEENQGTLTFVYAAKDEAHNNGIILQSLLT